MVCPAFLPARACFQWKPSQGAGKALQKHLLPALHSSLVPSLSKANPLIPTALPGRRGVPRLLQGWHEHPAPHRSHLSRSTLTLSSLLSPWGLPWVHLGWNSFCLWCSTGSPQGVYVPSPNLTHVHVPGRPRWMGQNGRYLLALFSFCSVYPSSAHLPDVPVSALCSARQALKGKPGGFNRTIKEKSPLHDHTESLFLSLLRR